MSSSIVLKRSYGVDVANYQSSNVNYSGAKFAIVKLTEGTGYINSKAKAQVNSAKAHGLLVNGLFLCLHTQIRFQELRQKLSSLFQRLKLMESPEGSYIADDWETGDGNQINGSSSSNTDAILASNVCN